MNQQPDNTTDSKVRALGLFSGGLDSVLACLVLRRAGVEVEALTFVTPFFSDANARQSAQTLGIPLTVLDVSRDHLERVVKNPRYGYGSNMNPCIDCHAYMIRKAAELVDERGFSFIFTGEVLGQRPMSQNRQSLATVAKASGAGDRLLRPLSAKLLDITPMEQDGLVEREKLLSLHGRGRKPQIALAKELGVNKYPAPAGGCLLTVPQFSDRLKDLLTHDPKADIKPVELLKHGRHFRLSERAKLVVGRDQKDNQRMEQATPDEAIELITQGWPGPLGLYSGPQDGPELERAAALVAGYTKAPPGEPVEVLAGGRAIQVIPLPREKAHALLI
jgi:tRNA-specific 2-thiouridylase